MTGPGGLDAVGAVAAVRRGHVHPGALLADARRRVAAWEPWLGAIVTDVDRPGTTSSPLAGVVIGVKEIIDVAGAPRTCGAPAFLDHPGPAATDAASVARLATAGAGLLATLASHALAYGIITPQTRNPRAADRIAGGSSGGAGAALAAGLVHAALGSDTGGSVRIPAACCGVVGLKTTRGLVPRDGLAELAGSLDTIGPMAATVADTRLVLRSLTGRAPATCGTPATGPRALSIGVPVQLAGMAMDPDVRAVWQSTLDDLADEGASVVEVDLPLLADAHRANGIVIAAEAVDVYGRRFATHGHLLPESTRARLARGLTLDTQRVTKARRTGARLRADLHRVFAQVQLLCTPTLPCRVPTIGTDPVTVGGVEEPVVSAVTRLVGPWNLTGVPAGTVPCGQDRDGAPVGVQLVGPWWGEEQVLDALGLIERLRGGPWTAAQPLAPGGSGTRLAPDGEEGDEGCAWAWWAPARWGLASPTSPPSPAWTWR